MRRFVAGHAWTIALVALAGCSRCSTPPTAPDASAAAPVVDAEAPAASDELRLRPVAITRRSYGMLGDDELTTLADGTIVFAHGPTIHRLHADGRRERFRRIPHALPLGTIGGEPDDLFVSDVESNYPSSTDADSWRFDASGKATKLLSRDVFYTAVTPWKDGRLLALRAKGAAWSDNSMMPYVPEAFAIARGAPGPKLPKIPKDHFVEDFTSLATGAVVAVATRYGDAPIVRQGVIVLRWKDTETPKIDVLDEEDSAARVVARSEDDLWVATKSGKFFHGNGKEWSPETSALGSGARRVSLGDDTVWAVSDSPDHKNLVRRSPDGTWTEIDIPDAHTAFDRPQLSWDGVVRVHHERDVALGVSAWSVAASGKDVWVVGRQDSAQGLPMAALYHLSRADQPVVDLDAEEAAAVEGSFRAPKPNDSCTLFVSAGPATEDALRKVRAVLPSEAPVVVARAGGTRIIGSAYDGSAREFADAQATKWRGLGLPAAVQCGEPALESLVFDPDAKDGGP